MAQTLLYHDKKLKEGKAEFILAENFLKDPDKLSHKDRLAHFNRVTSMNARIKANTIHVSLNFHSSENLSNQKMKDVAKAYMQKIGLDQQPYLVFRHHDAAHPHMHLVSTHIQRDGVRINLRNILKYQSRQAQREIEREFSLQIKADLSIEGKANIRHARKVNYGEETIMKPMHAALQMVLNDYKFTSLNEMNAILSLYQVRAYRGKEGSKMYMHKGLIYFALDEKGNKQGLPIKASKFSIKPTLANLEKKFAINEPLREPHSQRVKTAIDWTLIKKSYDQTTFQKALEKERVSAVFQRDKEGVLQGIYYVDHQHKTVFDGTSLGEKYNAQGIRERCIAKETPEQQESQTQNHRHRPNLY